MVPPTMALILIFSKFSDVEPNEGERVLVLRKRDRKAGKLRIFWFWEGGWTSTTQLGPDTKVKKPHQDDEWAYLHYTTDRFRARKLANGLPVLQTP